MAAVDISASALGSDSHFEEKAAVVVPIVAEMEVAAPGP
jgi:hypothetical protein